MWHLKSDVGTGTTDQGALHQIFKIKIFIKDRFSENG